MKEQFADAPGTLIMTMDSQQKNTTIPLYSTVTTNVTSHIFFDTSPKFLVPIIFNITADYDKNYFRHSDITTAALIVSYIFVFVLGVIGNPIVVAVVWRFRAMRTVTNLFIANLAIADMLVIIFCLPATLISNLVTPWILGLFLCKAVAYLQGVSVCASVNTLAAISVDRFLAICHPMKCQITSRGCRIIITSIWTLSFTLTLPWTVYFQLIPIDWVSDPNLHVCQEVWPTERMEVTYFVVANLILCYLFPLSVISICYMFIWLKVWRRKMPGEGHGKVTEIMIQRSKMKVVRMLLVVVIVFVLSWLPLYAIFVRVKIGDPQKENSMEALIIQVATPVAQWLGASNSCINPVLYAFFNSKFRAGFRAILFAENCGGGSGRMNNNEAHKANRGDIKLHVGRSQFQTVEKNNGDKINEV